MFRRQISGEDVRHVLETGEIIQEYSEDRPYPSRLVLGWRGSMPIHVVAADSMEDDETFVITVYEPTLELWEPGFRLGAWFQKEENSLKCVVCKQGEVHSGTATVTLERGEMILVFKRVPARVCQVCGEEYVDEETTTRLLAAAEEAAESGVQVDIRDYVAA